MTQEKQKDSLKKEALLLALKHGFTLMGKGKRVLLLKEDGTTEKISEDDSRSKRWELALTWLKDKYQSKQPHETLEVFEKACTDNGKCLKIFSDGGSRGNPGPSASGYVIMDSEDNILEEGGEYLGITTNNQAEYQAVRLALKSAEKFDPDHIHFFVDSMLVVKQMTGEYKVRNRDLWPVHEEIRDLTHKYSDVHFNHVKREYNTLADDQVNKILDSHEDDLKNGQ